MMLVQFKGPPKAVLAKKQPCGYWKSPWGCGARYMGGCPPCKDMNPSHRGEGRAGPVSCWEYKMNRERLPSREGVVAALVRVAPHVTRTPLLPFAWNGRRLWVKAE